MIAPDLLAKLRCPKCKGPIKSKSGKGQCGTCLLTFPTLQSIPLMVPHPEQTWREWQQKVLHQLATYEREISEIHACEVERSKQGAKTSGRQSAEDDTLARWQALKEGLVINGTTLHALMKPLLAQKWSTASLTASVKSDLLMQPSLMGYYANLNRDWSWGEAEIDSQVQAIEGLWPQSEKGCEVLILGSGAGGFSSALAAQHPETKFFQLDLNPFLLLVHEAMNSGQALDWAEFPVSPLDHRCSVVKQKLIRPQNWLSTAEQHLIWGDALQTPFADESFDLVLTPWIIDILPQDFERTAKSIARLLKKNGRWINLGPYGFHQNHWLKRHSDREVLKLLGDLGFEELVSRKAEVPYLNSPFASQKRFEQMLVFSARRPLTLPEVAALPKSSEWLCDSSLPVPRTEALMSYRLATETQAQIFALVDGQRSLAEIADEWGRSHGFQREEALAAVETLFRQTLTQ